MRVRTSIWQCTIPKHGRGQARVLARLEGCGPQNRASFKILESSASRPTEAHQTQNELQDLTKACPAPLTWLVVVWGDGMARAPPPPQPCLGMGQRQFEAGSREIEVCPIAPPKGIRELCVCITRWIVFSQPPHLTGTWFSGSTSAPHAVGPGLTRRVSMSFTCLSATTAWPLLGRASLAGVTAPATAGADKKGLCGGGIKASK